MSEINMSTRTYTGAVFPQFPLPSWVTVRVELNTFSCLSSSAEKKTPPFLLCLCLCCPGSHVQHTVTMQAQA